MEGSRAAKAQFRAQAKKKISALQFGILYCFSPCQDEADEHWV